MALIQCYECKKEISDKAPRCPMCGAPKIKVKVEPTKEDERLGYIVLFSIAIIIVILVVSNS